MHPPSRGLAFLLSLGSLPIACTKEGGETDTKASDPTGGSEGSSGSSGGVSGTTTTGGSATTGTPTTGASDSGTTGEPTTGNNSQGFITTASSTGATDTDTGGPPPVTDPTCIAYGAHIVECFPRYESYRQYIGAYCEYYKKYGLRLDGQACADAFDAMYICFSVLPCEEFMNEDMPPCEKEVATVNQDCPNLPEEGSTGGDTEGDTGGSESGGSSSSTG